MADTLFCVDFGESFIKVADAKKDGSLIDVSSLGFAEVSPAFYSADTEKVIGDHATIIQKLLTTLKITKRNVNIVIPDTYSYSQVLDMPKLNEKELISAIKYQADQFIPMPIDEVNIDVEILMESEKENKLLVLMIASSKKLIEKIQKTVELAGLIPESIENELSACSRFAVEAFGNVQSASGILLVNFSLNTTSLYFFDPRFHLITQTRNFNTGFYIFLKETALNLNLTQTQAAEALKSYQVGQQSSLPIESNIEPVVKELGAEIKRFVGVITQKFQINVGTVLMLNDTFRFPSLSKLVENAIGIPTSVINPYSILKKTTSVEFFKQNLSLFISSIGGNLR